MIAGPITLTGWEGAPRAGRVPVLLLARAPARLQSRGRAAASRPSFWQGRPLAAPGRARARGGSPPPTAGGRAGRVLRALGGEGARSPARGFCDYAFRRTGGQPSGHGAPLAGLRRAGRSLGARSAPLFGGPARSARRFSVRAVTTARLRSRGGPSHPRAVLIEIQI